MLTHSALMYFTLTLSVLMPDVLTLAVLTRMNIWFDSCGPQCNLLHFSKESGTPCSSAQDATMPISFNTTSLECTETSATI